MFCVGEKVFLFNTADLVERFGENSEGRPDVPGGFDVTIRKHTGKVATILEIDEDGFVMTDKMIERGHDFPLHVDCLKPFSEFSILEQAIILEHEPISMATLLRRVNEELLELGFGDEEEDPSVYELEHRFEEGEKVLLFSVADLIESFGEDENGCPDIPRGFDTALLSYTGRVVTVNSIDNDGFVTIREMVDNGYSLPVHQDCMIAFDRFSDKEKEIITTYSPITLDTMRAIESELLESDITHDEERVRESDDTSQDSIDLQAVVDAIKLLASKLEG